MERQIVVLGTGPAGFAAAIGARSRNKRVLVIGNGREENPLAKAPRIDNYPGLPELSGIQLLDKLEQHAIQMGAELVTGRVSALMAWDGAISLTVGSELYQASALVLAPGVVHAAKYPGEQRLLGRGVSYCATCDGMLYRGKHVMVTGTGTQAASEANYLYSIGCQVTFVGTARPAGLDVGIDYISGRKLELEGENALTGLRIDDVSHPCDGVFILRSALAPNDLLPGLAMENGMISVDRAMRTNLAGVYAAGDCTGRPYQVAKAVGEGLIAGQSAADYLEKKGEA